MSKRAAAFIGPVSTPTASPDRFFYSASHTRVCGRIGATFESRLHVEATGTGDGDLALHAMRGV